MPKTSWWNMSDLDMQFFLWRRHYDFSEGRLNLHFQVFPGKILGYMSEIWTLPLRLRFCCWTWHRIYVVSNKCPQHYMRFDWNPAIGLKQNLRNHHDAYMTHKQFMSQSRAFLENLMHDSFMILWYANNLPALGIIQQVNFLCRSPLAPCTLLKSASLALGQWNRGCVHSSTGQLGNPEHMQS